MKKTRMRSMVVYIMSISFLIGIAFFVFEFTLKGKFWAMNNINTHLSGNDMSKAGKILDRNNNILAQSVDKKRKYSEDKDIRIALLHTIGDNSINISTSIQNNFRAELFGYNIISGLGLSNIINTANDIKLTLNSELCKEASSGLGNRKGAVVVYNYDTGEIICIVSKPSYDPYHKPDSNKINLDEYEGVYINRALSSSYTPGSIFKIITATASLESNENAEQISYTCNGVMDLNGEKVTCLAHHGDIKLKDAMAKSCNIYFAKLALELGRERMESQAEKMGFNSNFDINGINLKNSFYDVSKASDCDFAWSGVGQYNDLVNPVHMMMIMGAIARGGTYIKPYLIENMVSEAMGIKVNYSRIVAEPQIMTSECAEELRNIMSYTAKSQYGSLFKGLDVCAKTGTAEVGDDKKPHGWIVGFSKNRNLPLAFSVIVENAGYGFSTAGVIASDVMQKANKIM